MTDKSNKYKLIIEAALFAAGRPLSIDRIAELFLEDERPTKAELKESINSLHEDYQDRGIELKEVASNALGRRQDPVSPSLKN